MPKPTPPTHIRLLGSLCRLLPLMSGPGNIANHPRFRKLSKGLQQPVWVKTRWQAHLKCRLDDYVGRSVAFFGDLDPKLSWVMKTVLRPGDTFVDVGANIGLLTTLGAQLVGPQGKVLAIDPQPKILDDLREAITTNNLSQVTLAPVAVGEEETTLTLRVPVGNYGSASLRNQFERDFESYPVPVRIFRDLLLEHHCQTPRLVKLDVEGFEAEVIRGAGSLWQESPPPVVIFEFREPPSTRAENTDSGQLLANLGYTFFRLPRNLFKPQLVSEDRAANLKVSHDIVAIHRSTSSEKLGFKAQQVMK
ncbi:MAG: FkbM family methyltransferase [Verrucomicrobiota bacterium]